VNWRFQDDPDAEVRVDLAEGEEAEPDEKIVKAVRSAAKAIAKELGGECHVEVLAHETTAGRGFRPGHVQMTVSRLGPKTKRK
jgi:hypothetical protein